MTDPRDAHRRLAEALDAAPEPERRARSTPDEQTTAEVDLAAALTHRATPATTKENNR